MVDLFQSLRDGARSAYCFLASPLASTLQLGGGIYRGLGAEVNGDDLLEGADLLRAASQVACNRLPDNAQPGLELPFTGGQCDDKSYEVTYTVVWVSEEFGTRSFNNQQFGPGPVSSVTPVFEPDGGGFNVGGEVVFDGTPQQSGSTFLATVTSVTINNINVVTQDGSPDDCGDPQLQPPEYNPSDWTLTQPVTYDDDLGNQVTIDPTFIFSPGNPDGEGGFSVPITINFEDGSSMFGDFNLTTGDINIGIGNSNGDGINGGPGELQPGEEPATGASYIVGVRVVATPLATGRQDTDIAQSGGNPTIFVPRIGNVAFKYQTSEGNQAWGVDIPIKGEEYIIFTPVGAVDVRGTPESGWSIQLFPIAAKREVLGDSVVFIG